MGNQAWRPELGQMVRFTQYMERWTSEEYEAAVAEDLPHIQAKYLPNPDPDKPAMVVGVISKSIEALFVWNTHDGGPDGESGGWFDWGRGKRRTFYVLKRTIRGKRFLVPLEDLTPVADKGAA